MVIDILAFSGAIFTALVVQKAQSRMLLPEVNLETSSLLERIMHTESKVCAIFFFFMARVLMVVRRLFR